MKFMICLSTVAFTIVSSIASAVTIDFRDLDPDLSYQTLKYPNATFTAEPAYDFGTDGKNGLIVHDANGRSTSAPFSIQFDHPVSNLKFHINNQYATGELGFAIAFDTIGNDLGIIGFDFADLNATTGITVGFGKLSGIRLVIVDQQNAPKPGAGLDFPSVSFDIIPAPEPAALSLFGLGALTLGIRRRRT